MILKANVYVSIWHALNVHMCPTFLTRVRFHASLAALDVDVNKTQ